MKKVLIALDFDPTAKKVAEKGFLLAKSMKAEVILLHVVDNVSYYSSLESSPIVGYSSFNSIDFLKMVNSDDLKKAAQYYLSGIKKHLADGNIHTVVESGDTADVILKSAKHLHAGVIVMGSHSRRWLEKILIGSVTEKVLHLTTLPLFIVPTKNHTL